MKQIEKKSFVNLKSEISQVKENDAMSIYGGYTYGSGYYIFPREDLEEYFDGSIPEEYGSPVFETYEISDDGQHETQAWVYHLSHKQFEELMSPKNEDDGEMDGSSNDGGNVNPDNSDWPYSGIPEEGFTLDLNKPLGSYQNPYSYDQYNNMIRNATWNGGYVKETPGYVSPTAIVFPQYVSSTETTFGDFLAPSSGFLAIADEIASEIISNFPIIGIGFDIWQNRVRDMHDQIKSDIANSSYIGSSNIYYTRGWKVTGNDVSTVKVFNAETGELITGYTLDMAGNRRRVY